jgi:hypothetical protein
MEQLNGTVHRVTVVSKDTVLIGDTSKLPSYLRNGTLKLVKEPIKVAFEPLSSALAAERKDPPIDQALALMDFLKADRSMLLH